MSFNDQFPNIIREHSYYKQHFSFLKEYEQNVLLYGAVGFPIDLFIDNIIKAKFDLTILHKTECKSPNKDIIYNHSPFFIELNLKNPGMSKNPSSLSAFMTNIIKNKNIGSKKHFIIIKNIDLFDNESSISFRIILEKFSSNAYFFCTTNHITKIDAPIKSRFHLIRMPLFTQQEIQNILQKYLNIRVHMNDIHSRNIFDVLYNPEDNNNVLCDFAKSKRKHSLNEIRQLSYQCFQHNIGIPEISKNLQKIMTNKTKQIAIIHLAAYYDHLLKQTNKGRESIYIEAFLCQIFL
jgi:hypothetical protein